MPGRQTKTDEGSLIGAQLIRHDTARRETLFLEQLLHQFPGDAGVAALLDQEIQNFSLIIDSAPQPIAYTAHNNHHFVQVSAIIGAGSRSTQVCGNTVSELQEPSPDGLVGDFQPTLGERFFDVPEGEGELGIKSQTAWRITSAGNRWRLNDNGCITQA